MSCTVFFSVAHIQQQTVQIIIVSKKIIVNGSQLKKKVNIQVIIVALWNHTSPEKSTAINQLAPKILHTMKNKNVEVLTKEFTIIRKQVKPNQLSQVRQTISLNKCDAFTAIKNPLEY